VDPKRVGHAGLVGWREKVGQRAARVVSRRTRADEDTARAVIGLAFLAIWLRTSSRVIRRLIDGIRQGR